MGMLEIFYPDETADTSYGDVYKRQLLQRLEQFDGDYDKMADETAVAVLEILQKLHNQGSSHTRTLPEQIKDCLLYTSRCV